MKHQFINRGNARGARDDSLRHGTSMRAFTLVELLVVIGIIALLISVLLPALARARRTAVTAQCLSNLHQMGIGLAMYEHDNRGLSPPEASAGGCWMISIGKYLARFVNPYDPGPAYLANFPMPPVSFGQQAGTLQYLPAVWFCPAAPRSSAIPAGGVSGADAAGGSWGGTTIPWGPGTYSTIYYLAGSYGINGWIYNLPNSDLTSNIPVPVSFSGITYYTPDYVDYFVNAQYTAQAANTPAFYDSTWVDAWPCNFIIGGSAVIDAPPATSRQVLAGTQYGGAGITRLCMARHGRAINVVFLDGHASTVQLADLWTLQWSPLSVRSPCPGRIP
jgi:prepilin-type processing-associated H-X9-DG protein/prepilin-type N-terminal cleavage/methylation domain-containing protein